MDLVIAYLTGQTDLFLYIYIFPFYLYVIVVIIIVNINIIISYFGIRILFFLYINRK